MQLILTLYVLFDGLQRQFCLLSRLIKLLDPLLLLLLRYLHLFLLTLEDIVSVLLLSSLDLFYTRLNGPMVFLEALVAFLD